MPTGGQTGEQPDRGERPNSLSLDESTGKTVAEHDVGVTALHGTRMASRLRGSLQGATLRGSDTRAARGQFRAVKGACRIASRPFCVQSLTLAVSGGPS